LAKDGQWTDARAREKLSFFCEKLEIRYTSLIMGCLLGFTRHEALKWNFEPFKPIEMDPKTAGNYFITG
jgi:hypothetical protein